MQALKRSLLLLAALLPVGSGPLRAQETGTAAAAKPVTFLGTVQAMSGSVLTLKSDAGAAMQVTVTDGARLLRIEPGQKSLAGASPFSLVDLQAGDRVMARGAVDADGKSLSASMLVAIKGADIAQKEAREREDWQKNGTGGLVKAVDPAASTVTLSVGAAATRTEVIHASPTTLVRRYAPGSVRFDQAVKSTLDQIKPGDQVRARGQKSEDGATLEAAEIVSGSFENLAGAVVAVNADTSTITLNDSLTKKSFTVTVTPESEVKKLDPTVAQRLAARMGGGAKPAGGGSPAGSPPQTSAQAPPVTSAGQTGGRPASGPAAGQSAGPDFQQVLARAPSITLKDLSKGSMVIVVATAGVAPGTATAITVVAGVEPIMQASPGASQAMLSSWNLGGGGGEGGGEGAQ